jgi:hypothetical protein
VYGLKEKNLAKTYIKLIPLGIRDPDAIRLLNWKKPTEKDVCILYSMIIYSLSLPLEKFWRLPHSFVRGCE